VLTDYTYLNLYDCMKFTRKPDILIESSRDFTHYTQVDIGMLRLPSKFIPVHLKIIQSFNPI
jgi:hypothetical protein